jgi:hypothetical protein
MLFVHSPYFVELDISTKHPVGDVYKPKGCIDSPIRFVIQSDWTILMFKINEWETESNVFVKKLNPTIWERIKSIVK